MTESRYHLAVDEKNCLSGFTVTSTRALSKRENLDNCEPRWRGTGVAIAGSHTNNRGFMMGARYFAPFSSRIASPRLLSLSLVPLSRLASARFTRNFVTSTRLRIEQLRFDDRSLESRFPRVYQFYRQIGERGFVVEILRVPRNTRRILFLYSHFDIFGSQRDFQSGNSRCRCSEVPRGRPRNFLLYFNLERNVPFVERKKKTFFGARLLKEEERRRRRRTLSYDSDKFKDLGIKSRSRIIFSKQISITERI